MNAFDDTLVRFFNSFAQRSHFFDLLVTHLSWNNLLKGGVTMTLFWWAWFRNGTQPERSTAREYLIATLIAGVVATGIARAFAQLLPFRPRPFIEPGVNFIKPFGFASESIEKWSAFPSDHAALFFALATGLYLVSRRLGLIALLHSFFLVCLPRIYIGVHHPTDILAGALIGVVVALIFTSATGRQRVALPVLTWFVRTPGIAYAALFLFTYQTAELFQDARALLSAAIRAFAKHT